MVGLIYWSAEGVLKVRSATGEDEREWVSEDKERWQTVGVQR